MNISSNSVVRNAVAANSYYHKGDCVKSHLTGKWRFGVIVDIESNGNLSVEWLDGKRETVEPIEVVKDAGKYYKDYSAKAKNAVAASAVGSDEYKRFISKYRPIIRDVWHKLMAFESESPKNFNIGREWDLVLTVVKSAYDFLNGESMRIGNSVTTNMSAQQAVSLVEMEIGKDDDEAENILSQYGNLIRRELGERVYRDLYDRAVNSDKGGEQED